MKSVIFTINTHNHQPIGNFDYIIEEAYEKSYRPFFEIASRYPHVKFGTHFTGILLDWLAEKHPDYLGALRQLVDRGQLEPISGGFYEPILAVIPPHDQRAQIAKLNTRIQHVFGVEPQGMWLAERVWEQQLASVLHASGIRYVFLDDTHFLGAGLRERDLNGYYLTEDQGKTLAVFPISKALRYTMPFASVDETIAVLRDAASEAGTNVVCFADDGEKFGVWPKTFEHVYGEGWLEEFFAKLSENRSWIQLRHASDIIRDVPPAGRIYLPNASYAEMMQWALPSAAVYQEYEDFVHSLEEAEDTWRPYLPFVRGGFWRNFFAKYPETNHLHKRVLRLSEELRAFVEATPLERSEVEPMLNALLAAQCNDPYWHGVFGGIYLNNLRHANYTELLRAEAVLQAKEHRPDPVVRLDDFNCDGRVDLIVETDLLNLYFDPAQGCMLTELDVRPRHFNALNIMNRQREAYHAKLTQAEDTHANKEARSIHDMVLSKEEGLEKLLIYDWYRHGSFIDHFLGPNVTLENAHRMEFEEQGSFLNSVIPPVYEVVENGVTVRVDSHGTLNQGGLMRPLRFMKQLHVRQGSSAINVTYRFTNESPEPLGLRYAPEWTFNLLAGNAHDRFYRVSGQELANPTMRSIGEVLGTDRAELVDEWLRLSIVLGFPGASGFWRFPIETVSLSEGGFERVYQGSIVWPLFDIVLGPHETVERTLIVEFIAHP